VNFQYQEKFSRPSIWIRLTAVRIGSRRRRNTSSAEANQADRSFRWLPEVARFPDRSLEKLCSRTVRGRRITPIVAVAAMTTSDCSRAILCFSSGVVTYRIDNLLLLHPAHAPCHRGCLVAMPIHAVREYHDCLTTLDFPDRSQRKIPSRRRPLFPYRPCAIDRRSENCPVAGKLVSIANLIVKRNYFTRSAGCSWSTKTLAAC